MSPEGPVHQEHREQHVQTPRGVCPGMLNKARHSVAVELGRWDMRLEVRVGRGHIGGLCMPH